jgi:predicted alpha/beta-fold hydrolase
MDADSSPSGTITGSLVGRFAARVPVTAAESVAVRSCLPERPASSDRRPATSSQRPVPVVRPPQVAQPDAVVAYSLPVTQVIPSFRPAWWLRGRHPQTVGGRLLRPRRAVGLRRERIDIPDGDFLDLDWAESPEDDRDGPLVVLLHGLEGSARSGYALELYRQLHRVGLDAVGLNFRSCSGEPNRRPRLYHSGETGDLEHLLEMLRARFPHRPLAAVGVSLGGNVLLVHLGRRGDDTPLAAAAVISVPFDLAAGSAALDSFVGRHVYLRVLLRSMQAKARARAAELGAAGADIPRALAARGFHDFDDALTAPIHGFDGVDDYYGRCSSGQWLPGVRRPTALLHALDDPFMPSDAVACDAIAANPHLVPALQPHGGHVGFVEGATPLRPRFWAEREAARFVAGVLGTA